MIKKLIKFGVAMFILFCVVVGAGSVYVYLNQDDLKQIALDKLNGSVDATLHVSRSGTSFFRTFPFVGIHFDNPIIHTERDTLLICNELRLKLNLIDFINKDYRINNLTIKDGDLYLKTLMNGDPNYKIWRTSERDTGNVNFEIEDIDIENIQLVYQDLPTKNTYNFFIDGLSADLQMNSDEWFINLDGLLEAFNYTENQELIVDEKKIKLNAALNYSDVADRISFSAFNVTNERVLANGSGSIGLVENEKDIDIIFKARGDASGILKIFGHYFELPENYTTHGDVQINANLYYEMGNSLSLKMLNELVISDGLVKESTSRERLEHINYSGVLEITGNRFDLMTKVLTCKMRQGILNASGSIKDLRNPTAQLQFQGNFDLKELTTFIGIDGIEIDGAIAFNNRLSGSFKQGDFNSRAWIDHTKVTGEARLKDASIEWREHQVRIKDINGDLEFSEMDIALNDLKANLNKTNFKLNGLISNVLKYATVENESIQIEAYLEADEINLEDFIVTNENSIHQSALSFPENINFKLNSNIDNFIFKTFRAEEIKGVLTYDNKFFKASHVAFNSCGGEVIGDLSIRERDGQFQVESSAALRDLNITQIFESFAEFDQDFITSRHISGVTTSTCTFSGIMDPYLNMNKKSIETVADIQISNGELIQHPPMQEIAVYLKKKNLLNPFLKVDELEQNLKHLSFNTIQNRIEIKDEMIYIPKMEIQSNAMAANITGSHSFNHEIDYRIDFRMREMLKEREVEIEEIIVEDDGTGSRIFLAMTGTAQQPEISFDKESARAKRKSDIHNAKEDFLNIFKKKDNSKSVQEKDIQLEIEDNKQDSIIASTKKKKGLKKLLDNITREEKNAEAVDFEIVDDEE